MASFFGEILPTYSRAVDEDEEEDEESVVTNTSVVRWSPAVQREIDNSPQQCIHCAVVIIAIGPAPAGFVQTYLMEGQKSEILGVICSGMKEGTINTFSQKSPTDKTCYIHRLVEKPEMVIVQCNTDVSSEQSYSWTNELFSRLNQEHTYVAVLATSMSSDYKSELAHGDLPTPFVRTLKTVPFKGTPICPYLEQPNTISGLPAQILSYCEVHKVAAVLYMCYTDVSYVDPDTMKSFQKILKSTPIKDFVIENPTAEKQLAHLMELHNQHSTLYL